MKENNLVPSKSPVNTALILCVLVFLFFVSVLYFKYSIFGYEDWDLAFFSQALWNLTHGQYYSSLFEKTFFSNHTNFIAYLFVPFYKVFPHPFFLIVLKVLSLSTAAYVFYVMAKPYVGEGVALLFMLLYLFYPPNVFGLLYEFDFESLAPVVIFALLYCFEKEKWIGFLLFSLVLITIKENLPLIVMAFGALGFLTKKNKWLWGLFPFVLGGLSFYVLTSIVVPFLNYGNIHHPHPYAGNYSGFGKTLPDVLIGILTSPQRVLSLFADPDRIQWLFDIFRPVIFLSFFHPPTMLLALPIMAQHFLSAAQAEQSVEYAYVLTFAPFIFLGVVRALAALRMNFKKLYIGLIIIMCLSSAANFWFRMPHILFNIYPRGHAIKQYLVGFKSKILQQVPAHSSVIATFAFLPGLSLRPDVYAFYRIYGRDFNQGVPRAVSSKVPPDVRYACIDFGDSFMVGRLMTDFQYSQSRIYGFFQNNWSVKDALDGIVLFERKNDPLRLVEVSQEPFPGPAQGLNALVDGKFSLLSVAKGVRLNQDDDVLPLTFYWKAERKMKVNYAMRVRVKQNNRIILERFLRIGYAIYPTHAWQPGDHIKDRYWLYAPGVDLSRADLVFDFFVAPDMEQKLKKVSVKNQGDTAVPDVQEVQTAWGDLK